MKAVLLKRLLHLEEVRAAEPRLVELQFGYLKKLPPDYTGERHVVTVGRNAGGTYRWEERYGPEPDEKLSSIPPFRVVLTLPEEDPAPGAQPR